MCKKFKKVINSHVNPYYIQHISHILVYTMIWVWVMLLTKEGCSLQCLLINIFLHIPYLSLTTPNTLVILCLKGHFMSLIMTVHESSNTAMKLCSCLILLDFEQLCTTTVSQIVCIYKEWVGSGAGKQSRGGLNYPVLSS